jgi:hypothetical protein
MEALQLEIGCIGCPLSEPFEPMGAIVMHCWLHSFWEVVFTFKLRLEIDYPEINDMTITSVAIQQGFVGNELLSIKHCRLASCSVFLSDVVGANGRHGSNQMWIISHSQSLYILGNCHPIRTGQFGIGCGSTLHPKNSLEAP